MRFINDNGLLYESQYGFRKHHNTIHGVTELVHNIIHGYEKGEMTIGVMADLSKAFDTIDHGWLVCWSLTSLCHSNGHIETMPAR